MPRRIWTWIRANWSRLLSVVVVIGVFVFVLPRVADYGQVLEVVKSLSTSEIIALIAVATLNLLTFGPPWMAAFPGLSLVHSLVMSQASTAAASLLPGGDAVGIAISYQMLRKWGYVPDQIAVGAGATTVWNAFANVIFAVSAAVLLAMVGESDKLLTTAAWIGSAAVAVAIALFALALHDEDNARLIGGIAERLWNRLLRLLRREPKSGFGEWLARFRAEAIGLLRRRWHVLTLATLAGHLTVYLVLLVSLRACGVSSNEVSWEEAYAAWALIRVITTIPITPGGLGIVELGLTGALVSFGGRQVEVVAAVLLYRVLTYVPPIAIGGVCLLVWRRLGGVVAAPPPSPTSSEST